MISKEQKNKFFRLARKQAVKLKTVDELSKQEQYLFKLSKRANRRLKTSAEGMRYSSTFDKAQAQFVVDYRWCNILLDELKEIQNKRIPLSKYDADSEWLDDFVNENYDWVTETLTEKELAAIYPDVVEDMKYSEDKEEG